MIFLPTTSGKKTDFRFLTWWITGADVYLCGDKNNQKPDKTKLKPKYNHEHHP